MPMRKVTRKTNGGNDQCCSKLEEHVSHVLPQGEFTHDKDGVFRSVEEVILGKRSQQGHKEDWGDNHPTRHGDKDGPVLSRSRLGHCGGSRLPGGFG